MFVKILSHNVYVYMNRCNITCWACWVGMKQYMIRDTYCGLALMNMEVGLSL